MQLSELTKLVDGELVGRGDVEITGIATLEDADASMVSFLTDEKYADALASTKAGAVLVGGDYVPGREGVPFIQVADVNGAIERLLEHFAPAVEPVQPGVSDRAVVAGSAKIDASASVTAGAIVGAHVVVGQRSVVGEGVVLREGVTIGCDTVLHPNVVIEHGCTVGDRVIIYANTTIGTDGFGYRVVDGRHKKIPHIGTVVIEDDVEIGANCCVDRAKFGETVIGQGSKIDNLVQVAHNVKMGRHCILVSQVGVAGSCRLGNYVVIGGQTGLGDHVSLGDGAMVAGKSAVKNDIPAGGKWAGMPAQPLKQWVRDQAALRKLIGLSKYYKKIQALLEE